MQHLPSLRRFLITPQLEAIRTSLEMCMWLSQGVAKRLLLKLDVV